MQIIKDPGFTKVRLDLNQQFLPFDCGNHDLNCFLFDDAKTHYQELLAVTYLLQTGNEIIGYYSYLNDKVSIERALTDSEKQKRGLPSEKQMIIESYPAVKIGRLAISKKFQNKGYGTLILDYTKKNFSVNNKTGCRFIVVDACYDAFEFYKKNGFKFLINDTEKTTRLMYFNLKSLL